MSSMPSNKREDRSFAAIALGFGNLSAQVGTCVGHFYQEPQEWQELCIAFLSTGLKAGDLCIYVLPPTLSWPSLHHALGVTGVNVDAALDCGQLVIVRGGESLLQGAEWLGSFTPMQRERFQVVRWGGELTWILQSSFSNTWLWEVLQRLAAISPAIALCQYDLNACRGKVLVEAVKAHALCILNGGIYRQPLYRSPLFFPRPPYAFF